MVYLVEGTNGKAICIANNTDKAKMDAMGLGLVSVYIVEEINKDSLTKSFLICQENLK